MAGRSLVGVHRLWALVYVSGAWWATCACGWQDHAQYQREVMPRFRRHPMERRPS